MKPIQLALVRVLDLLVVALVVAGLAYTYKPVGLPEILSISIFLPPALAFAVHRRWWLLASFGVLALLAVGFQFGYKEFGLPYALITILITAPVLAFAVYLRWKWQAVRKRELVCIVVIVGLTSASLSFLWKDWYFSGVGQISTEELQWRHFERLLRQDSAFRNVKVNMTPRKFVRWASGTVPTAADLDRLNALARSCGIERRSLDGPYQFSISLFAGTSDKQWGSGQRQYGDGHVLQYLSFDGHLCIAVWSDGCTLTPGNELKAGNNVWGELRAEGNRSVVWCCEGDYAHRNGLLSIGELVAKDGRDRVNVPIGEYRLSAGSLFLVYGRESPVRVEQIRASLSGVDVPPDFEELIRTSGSDSRVGNFFRSSPDQP